MTKRFLIFIIFLILFTVSGFAQTGTYTTDEKEVIVEEGVIK